MLVDQYQAGVDDSRQAHRGFGHFCPCGYVGISGIARESIADAFYFYEYIVNIDIIFAADEVLGRKQRREFGRAVVRVFEPEFGSRAVRRRRVFDDEPQTVVIGGE